VQALKDRLVLIGYTFGWGVVRRMPEAWARGMFMLVAEIAWRRQGRGVQQLEANLRRVLGQHATGKQLRQVSRAGMRSYLRYWLEVFRLPSIPPERILSHMRAVGHEKAAFDYMAAGRGVIFALPHMSNWDHAGAWIIARGADGFTTVQEHLRPEALYQQFLAFRENLGFEALPLTGGASPFGVMAQRLRAGRLVCLLCDRDLTASGVEVDFFGERARMAAGPAALAVQTGAALMPVTLWYDGEYWCANISSEIPAPAQGTRKEKVAVMTQQMAKFFEKGIGEHPEDWHMLQKVFVADLDPARLRQAVGDVEAGDARPPGASAGGAVGTAAGPGGTTTGPGATAGGAGGTAAGPGGPDGKSGTAGGVGDAASSGSPGP
jgi:phosphatidylinositol dimannoside acyltransferase